MPGRHELRDARWLHHAGLVYIPLNRDESLTLTTGRVTGSWKSINENRSASPVSDSVFLPVLEHGPAPKGTATGFAIRACAAPDAADALVANLAWRVLRNDTVCQAGRAFRRWHADGGVL
ncbi:polysaccharide lyase family 8 super-sandwich domain-containing protein [Termitidicoccus mucosus]|uniref:polysaccharide lyase family 8 super-sandwich domain-containing protein n=1 Tax=Termitidicoccus mucosus TaxID=1184151 RepID=UPI003CCDC1D7